MSDAKMKMIEVLVSTQNCRDPEQLAGRMNINFDRASLCIVNQEQHDQDCRSEEIRPGLRILSWVESGLARSRNRLLEAARGDICIFADDDIVYVDDAWDLIQEAHLKRPDCGMISFQFSVDEGREKKYDQKELDLSIRSLHRVSSIEITFKPCLLPKHVRFDERFGLGTPYPRGAENIFLHDWYREGTSMAYVPAIICEHKGPPTARRKTQADLANEAPVTGVVLRRLYPMMWPFFLARDCVAQVRRGASLKQAGNYAIQSAMAGIRSVVK